jgi:16S rRNA (guanine(966)-N(2))-methyltransferase RsmD
MRLASPRPGVRPTSQKVREAIFSALGGHVEGATVLDLFAGSGALGFEALSRGASSVTFVDKSWACIDVIRKNAVSLGVEGQAVVVRSDAAVYVRACTQRFDVIFMDPPYHKCIASDLAPDVYNLLDAGGVLVIEHESAAVIPVSAWKQRRYGGTTVTYVRKE